MIHWNFFLAIENDLKNLNRFIDFSEENSQTFSLETARILMAACAELDVVLKQLCQVLNPASTPNNINEYHDIIISNIPSFKGFKVLIPSQKMEQIPWDTWELNKPPAWWTANNKVKHQRHEDFNKATLYNCINSVAGLYVSILHLYKNEAVNGELLKIPELFNVSDFNFGGTKMGRFGHSFCYKFDY